MFASRSAAVLWLLRRVMPVLLWALVANAALTGQVAYFPHAACESVLITLQLESDAPIAANTRFAINTPGLTSGSCKGDEGEDIDVGRLLISSADWTVGFEEGSADEMFEDSRLLLEAVTAIAASAFTIRIDPSNGIKLTCYPHDSVDSFDVATPATTWPLAVEPFAGCPVYQSQLTFHPGIQYQPTEIHVTLALGMLVVPGENVTVAMPGFTSGSALTAGSSIARLEAFSLYYNASWLEGPEFDTPQLLFTRNELMPVPSAVPVQVIVSRQNLIKPLRNSWTKDQEFSFAVSGAYGSIATTFAEVDSVGNGCQGLNGCSGHGVCDLETNTCICETGFGAPSDVFEHDLPIDCSGRVCPAGVAGFGTVSMDGEVGHPVRECSNNGLCDRATGRCKCFEPFMGSACELMRCPKDCSGRGVCLTLQQLADHPRALPLREPNSSITYLPEVNGPTWAAGVVTGCLCDSTWPVGLGPGETQTPEFFGADCSLRHCPSGDDPETAEDETDCTGVVAAGGQGVGLPGNKCHIDCSNRGSCDFKSGVCQCFQGYWGENCGTKDIHAAANPKSNRKS